MSWTVRAPPAAIDRLSGSGYLNSHLNKEKQRNSTTIRRIQNPQPPCRAGTWLAWTGSDQKRNIALTVNEMKGLPVTLVTTFPDSHETRQGRANWRQTRHAGWPAPAWQVASCTGVGQSQGEDVADLL
jgi:hypothetical protein